MIFQTEFSKSIDLQLWNILHLKYLPFSSLKAPFAWFPFPDHFMNGWALGGIAIGCVIFFACIGIPLVYYAFCRERRRDAEKESVNVPVASPQTTAVLSEGKSELSPGFRPKLNTKVPSGAPKPLTLEMRYAAPDSRCDRDDFDSAVAVSTAYEMIEWRKTGNDGYAVPDMKHHPQTYAMASQQPFSNSVAYAAPQQPVSPSVHNQLPMTAPNTQILQKPFKQSYFDVAAMPAVQQQSIYPCLEKVPALNLIHDRPLPLLPPMSAEDFE